MGCNIIEIKPSSNFEQYATAQKYHWCNQEYKAGKKDSKSLNICVNGEEVCQPKLQ